MYSIAVTNHHIVCGTYENLIHVRTRSLAMGQEVQPCRSLPAEQGHSMASHAQDIPSICCANRPTCLLPSGLTEPPWGMRDGLHCGCPGSVLSHSLGAGLRPTLSVLGVPGSQRMLLPSLSAVPVPVIPDAGLAFSCSAPFSAGCGASSR